MLARSRRSGSSWAVSGPARTSPATGNVIQTSAAVRRCTALPRALIQASGHGRPGGSYAARILAVLVLVLVALIVVGALVVPVVRDVVVGVAVLAVVVVVIALVIVIIVVTVIIAVVVVTVIIVVAVIVAAAPPALLLAFAARLPFRTLLGCLHTGPRGKDDDFGNARASFEAGAHDSGSGPEPASRPVGVDREDPGIVA